MESVDGVLMVEIDSGDILEMHDEGFQDLIDEINEKYNRMPMSLLLGVVGIILSSFVFLELDIRFLPIAFLFVVGMCVFGHWLDSFRRAAILFYNFEAGATEKFRALVSAFEGLGGAHIAWHIPARGEVNDLTAWKRNAGADRLLRRVAITLQLRLPKVVRCNIDVPCVPVGVQNLYFFPDFLLVQSRQRFGAIGYDKLEIHTEPTNFIEEEQVPRDTRVLYETWKHPNKRGGPDRRFKYNRQIPVCRYEAIHFSSGSGVNELVQVSRFGHGVAFAQAIAVLGKIPRTAPAALISDQGAGK